MKKRLLLLITIISFINFVIYSQKPSEDLIIKIINNNCYLINYKLITDIDKKTLLEICYETSHLKNYLNKIVKLTVIDTKNNLQIIAYEIKFFFLYNYSEYHRQLIQNEDKIIFKLSYFDQNVKFIPKILELNGYYKITEEEKSNKVIMEYYQITKIEKNISERDLIIAKNQIKTYFNNLKKYIKKFQRKQNANPA